MCGIVAACTQRDVAPILLAASHALEYRGYDSAGIAVLDQGRLTRLRGVYAITVIHVDAPGHVVGARRSSPLCVGIGIGIGEHFLGSDVQAADDGDIVEIAPDPLTILDAAGQVVTRRVHESDMSLDAVERGDFRHYRLKGIFEQPTAEDWA